MQRVKKRAKIESVVNALSELENFVGARARAVQRECEAFKSLTLVTAATHVQG